MPADDVARTVLPIPDQIRPGLTSYDAKDPDSGFPPIVPLRPPEGAPNVLVILLDGVGFGASSAFGAPCQTPNMEALAAAGLKYNRSWAVAVLRINVIGPTEAFDASLEVRIAPPKLPMHQPITKST